VVNPFSPGDTGNVSAPAARYKRYEALTYRKSQAAEKVRTIHAHRIETYFIIHSKHRAAPGDTGKVVPHYGMCGTSCAAPVVSGTIALIWEQFRKEDSNAAPLPSTFKAILVHTANDINLPGPDFRSGYGRINATAAIDIIIGACPNSVIIEDAVSTDEVDSYSLYVPPEIANLKATLVWDDEPGTPGAAKELINDLDVNFVDPCGVVHYPWLLDHDNPAKRRQQESTG